ncbi:hypothetical protein F5B20DRAFT_550426 [Whalleya microplaca]|nr:hypothetical protein F5B20DRAFT_550426 [Whalleya microplaca]
MKPYSLHFKAEKMELDASTARARVDRAKHEIQGGWFDNKAIRRNYFSIDKIHFGYQPPHRSRVIRKPAEKDAWWNVNPQKRSKKQRQQEAKNRKARGEQPSVHAIGIVGYNYKSPFLFYKIPGNVTGKMTSQIYIQLLKPLLKHLEDHYSHRDFILWEDGDSSHRFTKNNVAYKWKKRNSYKFVRNVHNSPKTNWIESSVKRLKSYIRKYFFDGEAQLKELVQESWNGLNQEKINNDLDSMPQR